MAAVVSGSGLGLFNSSLAQLGQAHGGQAGVGQALEGQYVNVATGNLVLQDQDESILTRGLPISFVRTYNSLGTTGGVGQDGWLHGFERRVTGLTGTVNTANSTVRRVLGDGTETVFTWDAVAIAYVSTDGSGAHDTLTWNGTNSRWTWTEGSSLQREVYDASGTNGGRLMTILDVKSGATYQLDYDVPSGRLTGVVSNATNGDGLYFTYDAANGNRLQSINTRESGTSRGQVWFEYDGVGRLQSVLTDLTPDAVGSTNALSAKMGANDGAGNLDGRLFRTTYAYASASASDLRIASITQSDGTVVSYTYVGTTGQIATVTRGDTNTSDADGLGETLTFTYRAGETDVTDRLGRVTTYVWEAAAGNRLREVRMPADGQGVRDVMVYGYSDSVDPGLVTTMETRRGAALVSRQEFQYDARGNLTRHWSVLDAATGRSQRVDRTYSNTNQLLTETSYTAFDTDGRGASNPAATEGRTVRYLYDSTTGTVSTTTNNNRVRFVIDAEGRVTEYLYQTSGGGNGLVRSIRRFEAAYTATTFTLSALNTWATHADRNSRSTRTDFVYDAMGRVSEQRDFASVNSSGVGVLDAATQITRFTYDAQGMLRQSIAVRGSRDLAGTAAGSTSELTSYAYDGMGRLLETVRRSATGGTGDAQTVSTTVVYLDSTRTIVTTMDSGAVQTEVRNAAGRVVSSTQQSTPGVTAGQRESTFLYDAAGQLRAHRDASGAARYFLYDEDGRLATEVDATGSVMSYAYNATGQLIRTTAFANRVTLPVWPANRDGLPSSFAIQPDAARDRVSTREYDLAGRLTAEVDGEGVRVEIRYDAAGRVERRISVGGAGAADDRVTRYFYDKSDRQIGVLDAEGFFTESTYDGAGRMIRTTSYATPVAPANREAATIAVLALVTDAAKDRVTRHYYNGRDQKVGELDAEGYLTVWTYDEQGNSRGERRYANRAVGVTNTDTLAQALAKIASPTSTETRQGYNAQGQLAWSSDINGTTTTFHYDEAGRLVRTTRASGSTIEDGGERDSVVRLNSFGEVIGEISGESLQRALTSPSYSAWSLGTAAGLQNASEAQKDAIFASHGTRHAYDALGRKTETRDASGAVVWFFYDAAGRLAHTLTSLAGNSQVEIVQTRYDAFGQIIGTTSYSARGQLSAANSRESAQAIVDNLNAQGGSPVVWQDAWGSPLGNAEAQATSAQVSIEYDRAGRQTLLTRAIGGVLASETRTRTTYTAFGQIHTQTVADGTSLARSTTFGYDRRGIVSGTSESGGGLTRTTAVKTDAFGNAYEWTDARGVITTATHDRLGRQLTLTKAMDGSTGAASSGTSITTYDAWGRVLTHTDASNRTTTTNYNDTDRTITVSTGDGVTTTTTVNRHGETVSVRHLGGSRTHQGITTTVAAQETTFEYDRSGRLVKTTRVGVDDQAGAQSAQNGYDVRGLLVWSTDADGRRTIYRYDAAGRQLESILDPSEADAAAFGITGLTGYAAEPLRISSQIRVDGQGRTVEMTDGAGTVTRYEYDRAGQQTRVIVDPAGLKLQTVIERDALGQTVVVREGDATNPNLKVSRYEYDGLGRRTAERVDPDGLNLTTTYRYDANDNLVARVDANGHTNRYVYDADNRLRFVVDPLNGVEETRYDAAGRKIESRRYTQAATLSAAELTDLEANAPGAARTLLASRVSGLTAITATYAYDQAGQLESVTDVLGQAEKYAYDNHGRRTARVDRTGATWRYEYDAAGRIERETSPVVDVAVPQANGPSTIQRRSIVTRFGYDGAGNVLTRTEDFGGTQPRTFTFEYDRAGRLYREVSPAVGVATLAADGSIAVVTRSVVTQYLRNGIGQVTTRTEDAGQASARALTYLYDTANRLVRTTFPIAGAVNDVGEFVATAGVDANGEFIASGAAPFEETGYDALGRVIWVKDTRGHLATKSFDAAGRLRFEVDPEGYISEHAYDAAGNKTGLTRFATRYAGPALLNGTAPTPAIHGDDRTMTMQYDQRGFLAAQVMPAVASYRMDGSAEASAVSPRTEFRYDAAGQLRQEATLAESGRWAITTHFYDALGRRSHSVDALGYLTVTQYTALGQVDRVTEYARSIAGWSPALASGLVPTSSAPGNPAAGDAASGLDRVAQFDYDELGRKIFEVGANGSTTSRRFDALGREVVTQVDGAEQEHRYDLGDRLLATLDASRAVLDPAQALSTNFNTIRDLEVSRSPLTQYAYDAHGQVIGVRRLASGWASGSTIADWVTGAAAAPEDQITRFRRDGQGRVWAEERLAAPAGGGARRVDHAVFMRHDAADNLVASLESVELNAGVWTMIQSRFGFDAVGRQVATVVTRGAMKDVAERVAYNAFGEVTQKTYDGLDGVLQYRYDKAGRLSWTNSNGGQPVTYRYTAHGAAVAEERASTGSPIVIRMQVDLQGRTTRIDLPDTSGLYRQSLVNTLDRWGNVLQQVDTAPDSQGLSEVRTTTFRYNTFNQKTYERRPSVSVYEPDISSEPRVIAPEYHWSYDLAGRQTFAVDPYGTATRTIYDVAGQVREVTDGLVSSLLDGQWQGTEQADSLRTLFTNDIFGRERLSQYQDIAVAPTGGAAFLQSLVSFKEYNAANAVASIGTVNLQSNTGAARIRRSEVVYSTNAKGHRLTATGADGTVQRYAYDSQGRATFRFERGVEQAIAYDVLGNVSAQGGDGFTYNAFGAQTSRTDRSGRTVSVTYTNGMKTAETSSLGTESASRSFAYHANGLLNQITDSVGNSVTTYAYDARGNRTEETLIVDDRAPSGLSKRRWTQTVTKYDSHNRIDAVEHFERSDANVASTSARLFRVSYDYDANGNRTRVQSQTDLPGQGSQNTPPAGALYDIHVAGGFTFNHLATITHRMIGMYDQDGDGLTYVAVAPADWPPGVTLLADGRLQGTMPVTFSRILDVRVRDGRGGEVVRSFRLSSGSAGPANTAPSVVGQNPRLIGSVFSGESTTLSFDVSTLFADAEGHPFDIFPGATLPAGVVLSRPSDGQLNITINRAAVPAPELVEFLLVATERSTSPALTSSPLTMRLTVNPPRAANRGPVYNGGLLNIGANEGSPLVLPMPTGAFTDPDGDPLTYSIQVEVPGHNRRVYNPTNSEWENVWVDPYWIDSSSAGLSIEAATGTISSTALQTIDVLTDPRDGTTRRFSGYRVSVAASDGSASAEGVFSVSLNRRPTGNLTPVQAPLGTYFEAQLQGVADPESAVLTYTALSTLPAGVSLSSTGLLSGSVSVETTVDVTIRIADVGGAYIDRTLSFRAANRAPEFVGQSIGSILMPYVGVGTWSLPAGSFVDPDGQAMVYDLQTFRQEPDDSPQGFFWQAVSKPGWLSIDEATGTVRAENAGPLSTPLFIRVVASDSAGATGRSPHIRLDTANIAPPQAPTTFALPMPVVNEGYSFQLPVFTSPHPLDYTLTGFESAPGTLSFNGSSRTLSGTGSARWSGSVTYTARDQITGLTSSVVLNLVVNERPSVQNGIPTQHAVRGIEWPFQIPANAYTDPDGDSVKDAFLVVWNGTTDTILSLSTLGLGFDVAAQRFTGSPGTVGTHRIGLRVEDGRGTPRFFEFSLQVAQNQFPVISSIGMSLEAIQNEAYTSAAFPQAGDEEPSSVRYSMTGLPNGMTFDSGSRRFSGTTQQTGPFSLIYRAEDNVGQVTTRTYSFYVNDRPWVPPVQPQTLTIGVAFSMSLPAFTDADGIAGTALFGFPSGLVYNPSTRQLSGVPTQVGASTVTYSATDARGATGSTAFVMTVSNPANVAPVAPGATPTLAMALVNEAYGPVILPPFTDPNGDPLTYTLLNRPAGMWFNEQTREFGGSPTSGRWSGDLVYAASDGRGGTTSINLPFIVNERPSVLEGIPTQNAVSGVPWSFQIPQNAYTDPDGDSVQDAFVVVWNGSTDTVVPLSTIGLTFDVSTQRFGNAPNSVGTHRIGLRVEDGRGAARYLEFALQVAPPAPVNQPPARGPMAYDLYATANQWFQGWIGVDTLVDPEGGAITYTRIAQVTPNGTGYTWSTGMPGGLYADPASGAISGFAPSAGQYLIGVEGRDAQGVYGMTTIVLNVSAGGGIEIQSAPMQMRAVLSGSIMAASEEGSVTAMAAPSDGGWTTGAAPAIKEEIFRYDRRGRMLSRSGGAVTDDVTYVYGAAGQILSETSTRLERRAVTEATPERPAVFQQVSVTEKTETSYDQRGRRLEQVVVGEDGQRRTSIRWIYHADNAAVGSAGQLAAELQYFGPTEKLRVWTGVGDQDYFERPIGGWLKSLQTMTYDGEGRLAEQANWSRPALPRPVVPPSDRPPGVGPPVDETIGDQDPLFQQHFGDAVAWVGGAQGDAELWLRGLGGLDFAAQTAATVEGAQTRLKPIAKTVYTGYLSDGRLSSYSVHVREAAYGEEDTRGFRSYRDDYTVESWHGTTGGWVERSVRVERRLASGTQTDPAQFTQTDSAHPPTFLKVEVDAWGRQWAREQATPVKGSRDAYQRDVVAYTGEGQVALRRSFSKSGENWTQGNDPAKANYRFVYVEGQALAELREKEGGARIVALSASEHAQAVRGLGVLSGMATLSRGGHRIERTAGFEAFGVAGSGGVYEAGGGSVVAQPGDTLQTLSQRVYGSSSYWYVLAEANGYSDAVDSPAAGTSLRAPSISVSRNDAGTFRPYNANDAIGPNAPVMPTLPPSSDGCGKVGQLLMVVVAVIVTVYTAGAATAAFTTAAGTTGTAFATAGTVVAAGSGTVVVGSTLTALGGALVGAAAGAAGALASSALGSAMGISSFSWRSVATGALSGALTGGIAPGLQGVDSLRGVGAAIGRAAVGNAVQSAMNGGGFSWRNVAANVIGAAAGGKVSGWLADNTPVGSGTFAADLAKDFVGGVVSMHTRRRIGSGEGVDYGNAFAGALGGVIGGRMVQRTNNARAKALTGGNAPTGQGPSGAAGSMNTPMVNSRGEGVGARYGGSSGTAGRSVWPSASIEEPWFNREGLPILDTLFVTTTNSTVAEDIARANWENQFRFEQWHYGVNNNAEVAQSADIEATMAVWRRNEALRRPAHSAHVSAGWEGLTTSTAARGRPTAADFAQIRAQAFVDGVDGFARATVGFFASSAIDAIDRGRMPTASEVGTGALKWAGNLGVAAWNLGVELTPATALLKHVGYDLSASAWQYNDGEVVAAGVLDGVTVVGGITTSAVRGATMAPRMTGASRAMLLVDDAAPVADTGPKLTQYGTTLEREIAAIRGMSSPTPMSSLRQSYQQARGQIDFAHIEADVRLGPPLRAQGGHFPTSPNVRLVSGTESIGTNGSMRAQIELRGPDGNWYPKNNSPNGYSSLTPAGWSLARAKAEMSQAWLGRIAVPGKPYYVGTSSGVDFRFFAPNQTVPMWRGYPTYTP